MLIKNSIYWLRYLLGTSINIVLVLKFTSITAFPTLAYFLGCVLLNHYILLRVGAKVTGAIIVHDPIPTFILIFFKMMTLMFAFYYAFNHYSENIPFFIGIYIFQLIILIFSTKRIIKKNEGNI